jgi:molybdate transport system substrate-binding protein
VSAEIHVLSAGAIEPGLIAAADAFGSQSGRDVRIAWATTPAIRERLAEGDPADVVIATDAAVDDFALEGKVAGAERVHVGKVGVGVVMREGGPVPDTSSVDALKRAVLDAGSVAFNRASSGLYLERLLGELGILDRVRARTVRHGNGPEMMEYLINGTGREIGFGAIVEILMFRDRGLKLLGPLPQEVQNYTNYVAVPMSTAPNPAGARTFTRYLATPAARAIFAAHGID